MPPIASSDTYSDTYSDDHHIALRAPDEVMTLARLGSSFPHRLSFMRCFIRQLIAENTRMQIPICALDRHGFGHVVFSLIFGGQVYALIAYSRPLADASRTDRVIATSWDASFCLFDGMPDEADIAALAEHVTTQEAGRYHERILTLSRANKSVRLFSHVVHHLAQGQQPDLAMLKQIGYLMRTTAVYGNGKFGIADRDRIAHREGLGGPFQVEMLTVFLIREFTFFLVDYCAKQEGGSHATILAPSYRRFLGIGNSTGLGMAPFLVTHPPLFHSWIIARETALARVRSIKTVSDAQHKRFIDLFDRAIAHIHEWIVEDEEQSARIDILRADLKTLKQRFNIAKPASYPAFYFDHIYRCAQEFSLETQELIVSILLETSPALVDGLTHCMAHPDQPRLDPAMSLARLSQIIDVHYRWTASIAPEAPESSWLFWYVSEEKLEPRLGNRFEEEGAAREMPFNIPGYVHALKADLHAAPSSLTVAEFLLTHPQHRYIMRRIQTTARYIYAEIRDNLVGKACRPIDLLRAKLAFFGASKFDPKSDRWTRITLYQGAPTAADLGGDIEGADLNSTDAFRLDDWLFALSPPEIKTPEIKK